MPINQMPPEAVEQISTLLLGTMLGLWIVERLIIALVMIMVMDSEAEERREQAIDDLYPTWSTIVKHAYLRWRGLPLPSLPQGHD